MLYNDITLLVLYAYLQLKGDYEVSCFHFHDQFTGCFLMKLWNLPAGVTFLSDVSLLILLDDTAAHYPSCVAGSVESVGSVVLVNTSLVPRPAPSFLSLAARLNRTASDGKPVVQSKR